MLELALQLQPANPMARLQMAKLNGMTGKYAEAAATLEELEKADPKWLDPHIELAAIYYKLHRPDDGQRERDIVQQIEARQQKARPAEAIVVHFLGCGWIRRFGDFQDLIGGDILQCLNDAAGPVISTVVALVSAPRPKCTGPRLDEA